MEAAESAEIKAAGAKVARTGTFVLKDDRVILKILKALGYHNIEIPFSEIKNVELETESKKKRASRLGVLFVPVVYAARSPIKMKGSHLIITTKKGEVHDVYSKLSEKAYAEIKKNLS